MNGNLIKETALSRHRVSCALPRSGVCRYNQLLVHAYASTVTLAMRIWLRMQTRSPACTYVTWHKVHMRHDRYPVLHMPLMLLGGRGGKSRRMPTCSKL